MYLVPLSAESYSFSSFFPEQSKSTNGSGPSLENFRALSTFSLAFAVCAVALFLAGCGGGILNLPGLTALEASPSQVDLGMSPVGVATSTKVSLVNKGQVPVHVTQFSVTGQSFSITGQPAPDTLIPVGATYGVIVNFSPSSPGPQTGQLNIATDAGTSGSTIIPLSGSGQSLPSNTASVSAITCATQAFTGAGSDLCTVTLNAAAPSSGVVVNLSSSNAAIVVPAAVTVTKNATTAQFSASVSPVSTATPVQLSASAGTASANFPVQLNAFVAALQTSAPNLDFGVVMVNTPTTQNLTLSSVGNAPLTISAASATGNFSVSGVTFPLILKPGQTARLIVQLNALVQGPNAGQLKITSNASTNGTAAIALTGTGAPPLTGISCNSASMAGAGTDLCTATIAGPAPNGGLRVFISSNNAAVSVAAVALIHENATSVQFQAAVSPVSTVQTATLTATAGTVAKSFALQLTAPAPQLTVSVTSLAFGSVTPNTQATQKVTLSSTGNSPVTISGATVTGTGFSLSQTAFPLTINPGQSTTLSVQFVPAGQVSSAGQLTIKSNSSTNSTVAVALSGTGVAQVSGFSCNSASMGGSGTDICTVTISGPAPAGGLRVFVSSNNPAVTVAAVSLVHENTTSVQFQAAVSSVSTTQTVSLTANTGGAAKSFALQLNPPAPTLALNVTSLAFGSDPINTPITKTVTLSSTGTAPLTISGAAATGSGFAVAPTSFPLTINPGQTATLSVLFDPLAQGDSAGQLTVTSNSSTNPTPVIALSGTGTPQIAGITCANASMVGTGSNLCTVTISGPAPSGGTRVVLSSNNPVVTLSSAVLVHESTTSAQFTASVSTVSTAQTVTLAATVGSLVRGFALQLTVPAPTLSISSPSLAFGNVPINVTAARPLTLTSAGSATLTINAVGSTGTGFSVAQGTFPITLAPGQTSTLSVLYTPVAQGTALGQLTVASNSSTGSTAIVSVSGAGAPSGSFTYTGSPLENTLVPPDPVTPISSNFFGMTIHHTSTPFPSFPVSTFRFWDVAPWSVVEPASGQFTWDHMDTAIQIGNANGVKDYLFTFGSVPTWASTNPSDQCVGGDGVGSCAPPDMTALDTFTKTIVQRYCGVIKHYETWNEPNNTSYWDGTNIQLLTIAQHVYQIVKDPANCGCTDGSCAPNGGANPNEVLTPTVSTLQPWGLTWLDSYLATTGSQYPYADAATFHGYHITNPEDFIAQLQSYKQVLANHGLANVPVWNTEASWGSTSAALGQDQASWLMRFHMIQAAAGISRFVWYAYDNCGWGTLWESSVCVSPQNPVGQVTIPGQSYGVVESWLSGAVLPDCQQYQNGLWACELKRDGGFDSWMLWSSTGASISVPIPTDSSLAFYKDWQNNLNSLSATVTVNEMPILLENQPL